MTGDAPREKLLNDPAPKVVGTVHQRQDIDLIIGWGESHPVDILEYRLDCLIPAGTDPSAAMAKVSLPAIITARHPAEGGENNLDEAARLKVLQDHLPLATAADIELQSRHLILEFAPHLRDQNKSLIVSIHDFAQTPSPEMLRDMTAEAVSLGADIVKIATFLNNIADLTRLIDFISENQSTPLSIMGMGPLGPASRLLLAQYGSRLNYGYLSQANAPGQWPADILKSTITRFGPIH
jgi:3-dehydroquinate dehydratase-1